MKTAFTQASISLVLVLAAFTSSGQKDQCINSVDSLISAGSSISFSYPDSSFGLFKVSEKYALECHYQLGLTRSKNFIGLYYALKGEYDRATSYYLEAIEIAEQQQYLNDLAIIQNNLGALYFDLQEYEKSERYYEEALSYMTSAKDSVWMGKIYGNLAGVYFMKEEYDKSIQTLELSIEFARLTKRYEAMGGALANLAMVNMALGNKEKAIEGFDQGIAILTEIGDKRGVAISLVEKAQFLAQNNDPNAALEHLVLAENFATEVNHSESLLKIFKAKASIYEQQKNFVAALDQTRKLIAYQDSLHKEERLKTSLALEEEYQSQQKEQQITFLEEKNDLNAALIAQQEKVTLYLTVLSVCLALFVIFIYYQWQKKKKLNVLLADKNSQIQQNLKERELLVREIHHRVKNNLQIVSGMLNIQASAVADEKIKKALLESRKRVQSMAIVHTQLYQTDQIDTVNFKKYIIELADEIAVQFDAQNSPEVALNYNIAELLLPIDQAISLGLIVNEVLTNAYKYAFTNKADGQINLSIFSQDEHFVLEIVDNGSGFDKSTINSTSFGLRLIDSLADSLKANCEWINEHGTRFKLSFKYE